MKILQQQYIEGMSTAIYVEMSGGSDIAHVRRSGNRAYTEVGIQADLCKVQSPDRIFQTMSDLRKAVFLRRWVSRIEGKRISTAHSKTNEAGLKK